MDTYRDYSEASEPENVNPAHKASPYADSPYVSYFETEPATEPDPQPVPKKEKKKGRGGKVLLCALLIVALVLGSCAATAYFVNRRWEKKTALASEVLENRLNVLQQQIESMGSVSAPGGAAAEPGSAMTPGQVYAQNVRAVVAISNQATTTNIYGQVSKTASSGSGFIISPDGYVVSNYHVVEGATSLHVLTTDGEEYEAQVVGFDATNDVSLLKIEAEGLPYVTLGSSDALAVGDQVAAIGNPLGELTSTLTVGYVSAKDRIVTTDGVAINMLQTDAAINSGNSGGPLFNMAGEVVGITTAKYSGTSGSGATIEGIGFAIPIDDVLGIIDDLQEYGYVTGAYLGVMVKNVDEVAQAYGLPAGAYVDEVTPGYAAERAGMQKQDIIINVGGHDVKSTTDLSRVLRKFDAGETTTVTVYRAGQQVNLSITFDEKPVEEAEQKPQPEVTVPDEDAYSDFYDDFYDDFYGDFFDFFNPFFG